ncbi:hypothetical protein [Streptomyces sp. NPDC059918]|uniref:hypothetical protein n=1 Tax=unclassified Streptomyces TaxID=2593676 RepID=UPI003661ACAD
MSTPPSPDPIPPRPVHQPAYGHPQPGPPGAPEWPAPPQPPRKWPTSAKVVTGAAAAVLIIVGTVLVTTSVTGGSENTAAPKTVPMPSLVGKAFTDIPADISTRQYVNQRSAFGGTAPASGNVICFQEPAAGSPLTAAQNVYVYVAEARETCPARLGDLRPQPTATPAATPTAAPALDPTAEAALAKIMAPSIVEKQWKEMKAEDRKSMCDAYTTYGADFVVAMFTSGIKPGTDGYAFKDVLADAFRASLAKNC